MDKQIFREKSLEQLSEPEQLTEYLQVTGTGVWLVLIGLIVLLAGILVWGIFGRISSEETVPAEVRGGKAYCHVLADDMESTDEEIPVVIGDQHMLADAGEAEERTIDASADPSLFESGYLSAGKNVVVLSCDTELQDGWYEADVTTDRLRPISLLLAKN